MEESVDDRLDLMKKEIDSLQVIVSEKAKPWYKNLTYLISIIALLFSFGTAIVSYVRINTQDIKNTKQELRGLLQRLIMLPRELEEVKLNYDDPTVKQSISGFINQENVLVASQAADIIETLPKRMVSSSEYYGIASAFFYANAIDKAMEFAEIALKYSKDDNDFNTELSSMRMLANVNFQLGNQVVGRKYYYNALDFFNNKSGFNDLIISSTNIYTEILWANIEVAFGTKDLAKVRIMNAEKLLQDKPDFPMFNDLRKEIVKFKKDNPGLIE